MILVTGGAGFIGSFVCERLLAEGYEMRALDNLDPQADGELRAHGLLSERLGPGHAGAAKA